ncbi:isochorismatase family hydrolase [Ganoderma leucocontextum]|nr:isochorismatase family hydrolase [Ganoderma leucocontextum]
MLSWILPRKLLSNIFSASAAEPFRPALLVVDMQEDFCPPNGSLAVEGARDIVPLLNDLLKLPFVLKIATKDHHPRDHVSFASNHPGATPFEATTTIVNPANDRETYETRLWPDHCVAGTPGNELVPELELALIDHVVLKGREPRVEMYSAFRSPLREPPVAGAVSDLAEKLVAAAVTDVFVVGLAGDYCVKNTALDSANLGWRTYVIEEGTRSVGGDAGWAETVSELQAKGVRVIHADGPEVESVRALAS